MYGDCEFAHMWTFVEATFLNKVLEVGDLYGSTRKICTSGKETSCVEI